MSWRFAPDKPTEPGLYAVLQTDIAGDMPRLLRWAHGEFRLGARSERFVAFFGPIPECAFPHAEVEHLFNEPAPHPITRGCDLTRGGLTYPPSRARAFGPRKSR